MILTFYGHKGGTGRSAAVANVAPVLSSAGYRVLIVDFDLEAPGIHRFFGLADTDTRNGGVIELVEAYASALRGEGKFAESLDPAMLLEPQFKKLTLPTKEKLSAEQVRDRILGPRTIGVETPLEAWVKVLPAGNLDRTFRGRAGKIDWNDLYEQPEWRAFFGWFKETLTGLADIVILDARAGVTDMGALCLFALSDRAILLTPPTHQGLDGTLETADSLARASATVANHGLVFVASRVSAQADPEYLGQWYTEARKKVAAPERLGFWTETKGASDPKVAAEAMVEDFRLPEQPVHAVGEPIVALRLLERGVQRDPLLDAYQKLGGTIRRWISEGAREAALLQALKSAHEVRGRIEAARKTKDFDSLPLLWARLAEVLLTPPVDEARALEARKAAENGAALAAALEDQAALARLTHLVGSAAQEAGNDDAEDLLREAVALAKALTPGNPALLGRALQALGDVLFNKGGWVASMEAYGAALKAWESDSAPTGDAVTRGWLRRGNAGVAAGLYTEARRAYEKAFVALPSVNPPDLGLAVQVLTGLADSGPPGHPNPEGRALLEQALANAYEVRPLAHELIGEVLNSLAYATTGKEARSFAEEACRHLRLASPVPNDALAYSLYILGKNTEGEGLRALIEESVREYRRGKPRNWSGFTHALLDFVEVEPKGSLDRLEQAWAEVWPHRSKLDWESREALATVLMNSHLSARTSKPLAPRAALCLTRAAEVLRTLDPPDEDLLKRYESLAGHPLEPAP